LGKIKIGDTGFSTDCSYEKAIEIAELEARKVGGNAVKITKHLHVVKRLRLHVFVPPLPHVFS